MTYQELKDSLTIYNSAIVLDDLISRVVRRHIQKILLTIVVILGVSLLVAHSLTVSSDSLIYFFFYIALALFLISFSLESFYNSYYFLDLPVALTEPHIGETLKDGSFILAEIIYQTDEHDLTPGFLLSEIGRIVALRLGISDAALQLFTSRHLSPVAASSVAFALNDDTDVLTAYVSSLFKKDKEFGDFLFKLNIKESDLLGCTAWVVEMFQNQKRRERWWGRDSLGRIQGIGKDWSYGQIYDLEKYGNRIEELYDLLGRGALHGHAGEIGEVEAILARSEEANVLIIGDDEQEKIDMVVALARKIAEGSVSAPLEHKFIIVLDTNTLIAANATKKLFENELIKVLNQVVKAGNIILVIPDFPSFMVSARSLGSDVVSLTDSYLSSADLQVIAMSDTGNFHQLIESNQGLSSRFEKIIIREDDTGGLLKLLERHATGLEARFKVVFTYPALVTAAENAARYFMGQVISDKAVDMLLELPSKVRAQKRNIILKSDVLALVETKTGIPTGEVSAKEKDKLINLEKILHERIVGQDEAVSAISGALRRARSGVESSTRPLGSFLFLGPTGVGKTETTKALAEVFFGDENKILRLDMSEYNSTGSLDRLIGSFEGGKTGVLSSLLRDNPYGVLLLDEFEKAHKEVGDLFLQILDEGVFSDMVGKKVNARNLIIIATSNAGSDLIWDFIKKGVKLSESKDEIIDSIIKGGVFKPELLNRFDGVILFHPLEEPHLRRVAELMIGRLQKRLREKSVELVVNNDLIDYLVRAGSDPKFGARPINRAIQDKVEELVAEKLIKGEAKPGSKIILTREELA